MTDKAELVKTHDRLQRELESVNNALLAISRAEREQKQVSVEDAALQKFEQSYNSKLASWQEIPDWGMLTVSVVTGINDMPATTRMVRLLNENFGKHFTYRCYSNLHDGWKHILMTPRLRL